jgi:hypothetical protein
MTRSTRFACMIQHAAGVIPTVCLGAPGCVSTAAASVTSFSAKHRAQRERINVCHRHGFGEGSQIHATLNNTQRVGSLLQSNMQA